MTTLDRIPVDRITARARGVQFSRVALTVLAGVLYTLGWLTSKAAYAVQVVAAAVWFGLVWSFSAVQVGWSDARKPVSD